MARLIRMGLMVLLACGSLAAAQAQEGVGDVEYVPTPQVVVDAMLRMAHVGPSDYVIDLGSGDGRIVITAAKDYGARGFGVDLDQYLVRLANENAVKAGVADRAHFYERNIFETRLDAATVVTTYLLPELNLKLRPELLKLRPGTRVLAHDYNMGTWMPDDQETIPVPGKEVGTPGLSYIFLWIVPANIAGDWESRIHTGHGEARYRFSFDQLFQELSGVVRTGREQTTFVSKVRGDRVSFTAVLELKGRKVRHEFDGRMEGGVITGTVKLVAGRTHREVPWVARQTERREPQRPSDDVAE